MSEHHTQNTVGTLAWCNACRKKTIHRVSGKRQGHCTEHAAEGLSKKQEAERKRLDKEEMNPKLF